MQLCQFAYFLDHRKRPGLVPIALMGSQRYSRRIRIFHCFKVPLNPNFADYHLSVSHFVPVSHAKFNDTLKTIYYFTELCPNQPDFAFHAEYFLGSMA